MQEPEVPVFLIAGFLESGKTTFLRFTLDQDYFRIDGKTLLILCEEGEEEYDAKALALSNTVVEVIESREEFTAKKLQTLAMLHKPERVIVEYNGMWLVSDFEKMDKPAGWGIEQHIVCADASTFSIYIQNMKSIFMDMVKNADMVIFNRSSADLPLANYRRSIKAANQACEVIFEDENGEVSDIFQDALPFDVNADVIDIAPEDYGIWFIDATDNPDTYVGKTVHFQARVMKPRLPGAKLFIPGRMAMTCCANDMTFLGYVCKTPDAPKLKQDEWVDVTATVALERRPEYRMQPGPILMAKEIHPCSPLPSEMVYFN